MAMQNPAPNGVDTSTPNVARMYDYYLGGKDNFAADRQAADRVLAAMPELREAVRANRQFLTRAVRQLSEFGIRQFLDIGSGLPTQGNVHEVAQAENPEARVVYVDYDPIVCSHGKVLLEQSGGVAVVQADIRQPDDILNHPDVRSLIDFEEPVGVLLVAIVHFLTDDDDPAGIIGRLRDAMAPGSYLVMNHGTGDGVPGRDQAFKTTEKVYRASSAAVANRGRDEIRRLFDGFELIEPGLVWMPEWRATEPVEHPERSITLAGVGRKP